MIAETLVFNKGAVKSDKYQHQNHQHIFYEDELYGGYGGYGTTYNTTSNEKKAEILGRHIKKAEEEGIVIGAKVCLVDHPEFDITVVGEVTGFETSVYFAWPNQMVDFETVEPKFIKVTMPNNIPYPTQYTPKTIVREVRLSQVALADIIEKTE